MADMPHSTQIQVKINSPFSWLPNYLINDPNVSAEALAVAMYLNGKPHDWQARPFDIRKRFGWGDHKWRSVSKELTVLGLLKHAKHQHGTTMVFCLLFDPQPCSSPVKPPPVDFSRVRKPTSLIRKTNNTKKENKKLLPSRSSSLPDGNRKKQNQNISNMRKQLNSSDSVSVMAAAQTIVETRIEQPERRERVLTAFTDALTRDVIKKTNEAYLLGLIEIELEGGLTVAKAKVNQEGQAQVVEHKAKSAHNVPIEILQQADSNLSVKVNPLTNRRVFSFDVNYQELLAEEIMALKSKQGEDKHG